MAQLDGIVYIKAPASLSVDRARFVGWASAAFADGVMSEDDFNLAAAFAMESTDTDFYALYQGDIRSEIETHMVELGGPHA